MLGSLLHLPLRALALIFSVTALGLLGHMVHRWGTNGSGLIIYCLFVPAFALLSLLYLIPASTKEKFAGHRMIPLALDVLNTLLFLTAAIAFTVKLGAKSCKNSNYLATNYIVMGSRKRCREARAADAFLWFAFAAFLFAALGHFLVRRRRETVIRDPNAPVMAQPTQPVQPQVV